MAQCGGKNLPGVGEERTGGEEADTLSLSSNLVIMGSKRKGGARAGRWRSTGLRFVFGCFLDWET